MAYRRGDPIAAADLNAFAASLAAVHGIGFGDRGYGQTEPSLPVAARGEPVAAEGWAALREVARLCAVHQGTPQTLLPPASAFAPGQPVVAHERDAPSNNPFDLADMIGLLDANRLLLDPANAAVVPSAASAVRLSAWGSGAATTIMFTADFLWASEGAARRFFNTGGAVQVTLSHPGTGFTKDNLWSSGLAALGAIRVAARATQRTGSGGSPAGLGFYDLIDVPLTVFDGANAILGFGGTGSAATYTTQPVNDVLVRARRLIFAGALGGNGAGLRLTVLLTDEMPGGPDTVSAGTTATLGFRYAASFPGVPLPTVSVS